MKPEPVIVNVYGAQESIPTDYASLYSIAWRAGTINSVAVQARHAGNRRLGSLKGQQLQALAGRYDNPTVFLIGGWPP